MRATFCNTPSWIVLFLAGGAALAAEKDYPYQPVPFTAVHVQDSFWLPRLETNRTTTVWCDFKRCEESGRIDNFAKAAGLMKGEFRGIPFDDSDVFKVIEGASYTLAMRPDPKLDRYLDALIAKIAAAQEPDGYLYTARRLLPPEKMPGMSGKERWLNEHSSHELYNVGHMYEAAVAHYQATGKRTLLEVALKNADLIAREFGPGKHQNPPGHEEIEIGLVKLYRATGDEKYLNTAKFLIETRGRPETHRLYGAYAQDHKPVVQQDEAVGHAVRAGYLYSGVADVAAVTGDAKLIAAIDRIWENVVAKKLYLTGGIGARAGGEAFGENYELPNASAYNETCAAIANALWNQRMFLLHGDAKYIDVLERIVYNGFLSGVSLGGDRFFYPNPLENYGGYQRSPWFGCACCPVNVVRFIPSIPGYVYATRGEAIYVNLFIGGAATLKLGAVNVEIRQETRYPWDGAVKLTIAPDAPADFALNVRIPGWARNQPVPSDLYRYCGKTAESKMGAGSERGEAPGGHPVPFFDGRFMVNGQAVEPSVEKGYARLQRRWQKGDVVQWTLPMPVRQVVAHEAVKADRDCFAVERGPIVYCAEGADNGGKMLDRLFPEAKVAFETRERPDLLGGVVAVTMTPAGEGSPLVLIPYYAWCNRGPNPMAVWFRTKPRTDPASYCWPADSVEACFNGKEPKKSADESIPRMTWWDHTGTVEWVERRLEKPAMLSRSAVYWFDDRGRGGCRVPKSWRLLYKAGNEWKPVEGIAEYGTKRDQYNEVSFPPVETAVLRLEVKLQPGFSGGILQWKVQ